MIVKAVMFNLVFLNNIGLGLTIGVNPISGFYISIVIPYCGFLFESARPFAFNVSHNSAYSEKGEQ